MAEQLAFNMDCLEAMRQMEDNAFDLAVVDPPYNVQSLYVKANSASNANSRLKKYGNLGAANNERPGPEYFKELFRVSKNQIVFGFNHLCDLLPPTTEFIFWYKHNPVDSYSDGELAWTSFKRTAKCFDYPFFGATGADEVRIHPTQKPVALYKWIFTQYAQGGRILDTHLGSGSSRIAAYDLGLDFVGYELNREFFERQEERFRNHTAQLDLFH